MTPNPVCIRPFASQDAAALWAVLEPAFRAGDTYALPADISREAALAYWTGGAAAAFVAEIDGRIVGASKITPNQQGGGAHVANGSFVTAPAARGRGVARALCEHAAAEAARRGFRAMQFNFVVASNVAAVKLWTSLGFQTVGRLPGAFRHPTQGYVDALVMFRHLADSA